MLLPDNPNIFAYVRSLGNSKILVVCNFYGNEIEYKLPKEYENSKELLISNYETTVTNQLRPYEAYMCRI